MTGERIVGAKVYRLSHKVRAVRAHGIGEVAGAMETVNLRLEAEGGAVGWGEAAPWAPFAGTAEASFAALHRYLRPAFQDAEADAIPAIMARADALLAGHWDAKAALETALLDLAGRRRGAPVWALLGGRMRVRVPLSLSIADPVFERDQELMERAFASGIRNYKLKTGFADHAFDLMRIEKIRAAYPDANLRADYNQGLDPTEAPARLRDLDALGLDFIEQPVRADQPEAMAGLTAMTRTPILADESVFTPGDLARAQEARLANGVSVKIMKCGGPRRGLVMAHQAAARGWASYGGDMFETGIAHLGALHMIAAAPGFDWGCEFYHANWHLERDVLAERFPEEAGEIVVPDGPGLGCAVDEALIARAAVQTAE